MSRLTDCFSALKQQNRAALITYLMASDPDYSTSLDLLKKMPAAGADIIELGIPFTDPMADGPTIQKAALRALAAGQTLAKTLQMVEAFRKNNQTTPIVLMGYFNPIHHYGTSQFLTEAKRVGVDGLIVVDLPAEHDDDLCKPAQAQGIDFIRLTTPTTNDQRLPSVLANSTGFIYYVSVAGVTGSGSATNEHIQQAVARLQAKSSLPICVGFGIRNAEQAKAVAKQADGVVVGSAFVSLIEQATDKQQAVEDVLSLCRELSKGVKAAKVN